MKKIFLLLLLSFCICPVPSSAKIRLSAQGGLQFPLGNFGNIANTGYCLTGTIEFMQSDNLSFTGSASYSSWSEKTFPASTTSNNYTDSPLLIGIRYYFIKRSVTPYLGFELGIHTLTYTRSSYSYYDYRYTNVYQIIERQFGLAPAIGLLYKIQNAFILDINMKYIIITKSNQTAVIFPAEIFCINAGIMLEL